MLIVDKSLKIDLNYIILPLGFAISLTIKGGKELLVNFQEVIEGWPKFRDKNHAPITHNEVK